MFIGVEQYKIRSSVRSGMETGHAAPMGLFFIFRLFTINMSLLTELALPRFRNLPNIARYCLMLAFLKSTFCSCSLPAFHGGTSLIRPPPTPPGCAAKAARQSRPVPTREDNSRNRAGLFRPAAGRPRRRGRGLWHGQ